MHYQLEIVMPQVDDVIEATEQILHQFSENLEPDDEEYLGNSFWDFYSIGGRWAGYKIKARLDQVKLGAFYKELADKKVTVSSVQCGKQEISPASQIPMVDALWVSFFPEYMGRACPLFQHSNNPYENHCLYGDVMPFRDVPDDLTMSRIILAGYDCEGEKLEAKVMYSDSIWNGCNHEETIWNGTFKHGAELFAKYNLVNSRYKQEYIDKYTPKEDWLVVTVDYHS